MEPEEFYEQVKKRFSILVDKYGFDPVFELKPAGAFGLSQIIYQSNQGLIQFNVEYRELDVGILLSFDTPPLGYFDQPPAQEGSSHVWDCKWYPIVIAVNAAGEAVDYDRLYKGIIETEAATIVKHLLENWANELHPHWDNILRRMGDPAFQNKIKEMDESRKHQRIIHFDQHGMAKDFFKWLLKNIPIAIGYIVSLFLGLVLVGELGESVGDLAMLVVMVPPFLFYLILRYSRTYLKNRQRK